MTDPFSDARSSGRLDVRILRAFQQSAENEMAESFSDECAAELEVADHASALLLGVVHAAAPETTKSVVELDEDDLPAGGDTDEVRTFSMVLIGIRGWRAMRASRAVLGLGYEVESRALDRILVDLMAHRRAILEDPLVCHEAIRWIKGERKWGIGKQIDAMGAEGLYGEMSQDAHGDAVGAFRLIHEGSGSFLVGPARSVATRASLLQHAGFAYDQAMVTASLAGIPIKGAEPLLEMIRAAWARLSSELPAEAPPDAAETEDRAGE